VRPSDSAPTEFKDDLRTEWQRRGKQALSELTSAELMKTVALLMPKELLLELQDQRARLSGDQWNFVLPVLKAVRQALPDANDCEPEEVAEFVRDALRSASAKLIEAGESRIS
jgi:hypothetical protein